MNRVEELIQQLCPNGVEWKKLGEVCKIERGQRVTKAQLIINGKYPVISGGVTPLGYINECNREGNSITIAQYGSAGYVNWQTDPFWANDVCYSIYPFKFINNKYLYYNLKNLQELIYSLKTNSIPAHLPLSNLVNIEIPIPPLPIQQEIVRILDTFTELNTNLQTELEARKKQYAYYRDCLLNFEGVKGVEWKKLGEVGTFIRGKRFVRTDIVENGIPCIHYGDIYTFYGLSATQTKGMLRSELAEKMRYAHKNDVIIVAAGENKDDIGIGIAWLSEKSAAVHDACFIFRSNLYPKFLSHYLRTSTYHQQIKRYVSEGKICSISAEGLGNATIPIPPLSEQRRIVSILDQFETLVNDLSIGLPAELEARRKQYEYYQDKLLTFDRV